MKTDWVAYLLDTNVFSEMMRAQPDERVATFLDDTSAAGHAIAAITVWEIENGIGLLGDGLRRKTLTQMLNGVLVDLFEDRVLPWGLHEAKVCASLMEDRRRAGRPLDGHLPDAMIASMALVRQLVLVTRNKSDFEETGLELVDPWSDN